MRLAVLLVHGVGESRAAWAEPYIDSLTRQIREQVSALGAKAQAPAADGIAAMAGVHWGAVLAERRQTLHRVLAGGERPEAVPPSWLGRLGTAPWSLRRRWKRFERTLIADYLGDLLGFLNPRIAADVDARLTASLDALLPGAATPDGKIPLTIIAHSLGTVVSSNYVWDHAKARRAQQAPGFHDRFQLANFFSLGSPMALFSLKYGGPDAFKDPIRMEHPSGRWVNAFDADDPLGLPLRPLNAAYRGAVAADVRVEAGGYMLAHRGYFTNATTLDLISRKLALDWLAGCGGLPAERLSGLYAAYDRSLASR